MHETPPHLLERLSKYNKKVPSLGLGFVKKTMDSVLYARLLDHFLANTQKFSSEPTDGYIQTENSRAYPSLVYQDDAFNLRLLDDLHQAHEEWSGLSLKKAACYGIRVYQPGSYLYNHFDTATSHAVSSTICIDHRLSGPWPLYIEDNEGNAHEVPIEPGEMVFFEGARLMHGRPYALPGEYYANIFAHYTPLDWRLDAQDQPE
tara:strand:- start:23207 stop:23818 length:612 start_codon:yes stop_codon:yes gene_type:complete